MLLANDHLVVWLKTEVGGLPLVRCIRRGEWQLPREVFEHFEVAEEVVLKAQLHAGIVVVRPEPALREKAPGKPVRLSEVERQVLELMAEGLTTGQIALRLQKRRRWVLYRVAEIKRKFGVQTRAEAVMRKDLHSPKKD